MDAIAKIAFITARIIVLLDFISAAQYMIHFIYHFVHLQLFKEALNAHHIISLFFEVLTTKTNSLRSQVALPAARLQGPI